jgi:hypothetical protein
MWTLADLFLVGLVTIEVLRWLLSLRGRIRMDREQLGGWRASPDQGREFPAPHLESAAQIAAVLDIAAELDADPGWLVVDRLPVVAILVFGGTACS